MEFRHQAGLAAGGVVRMNDTLLRDAVQRTDRGEYRRLSLCMVAGSDCQFGLLDEGAGRGPERTIAQALSFGCADALERGLAVSQNEPSSTSDDDVWMRPGHWWVSTDVH